MKQNNLWTYGCSWTQGNSLKDVYGDLTGGKHSNFAYPKVLSKQLRMNCKNRGFSGRGNDAILHSILNDCDKWQENDIVIVMWSGYTRKVFYNNDSQEGLNLVANVPGHSQKWFDSYLKYDSNSNWLDSRIQSGYNRLAAETIANGKNILLIHTEIDFGDIYDPKEGKDVVEEKIKKNKFKHFVKIPFENDHGALDEAHPGPIWHAKVATYFYNYIKRIK